MNLTTEQEGATEHFRVLGASVKTIHFIESRNSIDSEVYFENCELLQALLVQRLIVTRAICSNVQGVSMIVRKKQICTVLVKSPVRRGSQTVAAQGPSREGR